MEPALVDIEMNVPGLEIRSTGLPDFCLRIEPLDLLPGGITDPFAVNSRIHKQQFQFIMLRFFIDFQDKTPDNPAILADTISDSMVDTVLDGFPGNDFSVLFK